MANRKKSNCRQCDTTVSNFMSKWVAKEYKVKWYDNGIQKTFENWWYGFWVDFDKCVGLYAVMASAYGFICETSKLCYFNLLKKLYEFCVVITCSEFFIFYVLWLDSKVLTIGTNTFFWKLYTYFIDTMI